MNSPRPPRFQVSSLDGKLSVRVADLQKKICNSATEDKPTKRNKPWYRGPAGVVVYKSRWRDKVRRRIYVKYVICWRDSTGRHREARSDPDLAKRLADEKGNALLSGENLVQLTIAERIEYREAKHEAAAEGLTLREAVQEAVQARRAKRLEATRGGDKTCPQILTEMLEVRKRDGLSQNTLDDYASRLGRFTEDFTGRIGNVTSQVLDQWLSGLEVSRRTRNNYRGNLVDFFRFAQRQGYVPKGSSPMADVPRVKNEPVRIQIFTPDEAVALLAHALPNLVPYLAIGLFAGLRHEEMCAGRDPDGQPLPVLDWRQVDFEKREIWVLPEVARKIGHDRVVPMQANLIAWLKPHARPNGPVCELANVTNALLRTARRAKVKWKDNGPRKSFISYRLPMTDHNISLVAREAGTSPDRILHNYQKTAPKREAKRWFDIWPTTGEILQLRFTL